MEKKVLNQHGNVIGIVDVEKSTYNINTFTDKTISGWPVNIINRKVSAAKKYRLDTDYLIFKKYDFSGNIYYNY